MDAEIERARRAEPAWDELRERRVLSRVLAARSVSSDRPRRRAAWAVIAVAAVVLLAWVAWPAPARAPIATVPTTPPSDDDAAHLVLADGSDVELGADANVRVALQSEQEVRLVQQGGRARYVVSHRPERAFVVEVGDVEVQVRGTIFVIGVDAASVDVSVEQGRVEVTRADERHVLGAGEGVRLSTTTPATEPTIEPSTAVEIETSTPPTTQTRTETRRARATPEAPPPDMTTLLAEANAARRDGRLAEAADTLRAAVAAYPDEPRVLTALFTLGRVERSRGRDRAAAEAFDRVVAHDEGGVLAEDALAESAVSWSAAGSPDRARATAARYLARFPSGTYAPRMRSLAPDRYARSGRDASYELPRRDRALRLGRSRGVLRLDVRFGFVSWCLLVGALAPALAHAQVRIAAPACSDLDVSAIEGFLAVEIAEVAAEWREVTSPVVLLGCASDRVRIEITDPVTDKSVARTVAWPSVDREHVLALAIAQLFLTSWLELLIAPDAGPGDDAALALAREAVAEAAMEHEAAPIDETPVVTPPATTPLEGEIGIEGGARSRLDGEQLATGSAALRGSLIVDRALVLGARLGFEWGRAIRTRGAIELFAGTLGVVVGWRTPRAGPFFADLTTTLSAVVVVLEGRPTRADVTGGTTRAIAGEGGIEIAPSLALGPVVIALPLGVGGVALAPDGEVSGEAPVVINGPVLSAQLRVSFAPSSLP